MVEVTLEALVGLTIAGTTAILAILRHWKNDICQDIQATKADMKLSHREIKEYLETRERITMQLDQRLSRLEGRNQERDMNRDPLAYNSYQKEVYSDGT